MLARRMEAEKFPIGGERTSKFLRDPAALRWPLRGRLLGVAFPAERAFSLPVAWLGVVGTLALGSGGAVAAPERRSGFGYPPKFFLFRCVGSPVPSVAVWCRFWCVGL